jgi:hypothetical protein
MPWSTIYQILGFIGGFLVLISTVGSWYYGKIEDKKKQLEIESLGTQNSLMMHAMENSGQAKWHRDEKGEITGVIVNLSGEATSEASAAATLSARRAD